MSTTLVRPEVVSAIGPVDPPFVAVPSHDVVEYSYGFEDYAALPPVPAQQVYSFGFETYNAGGTTVPAQQVYSEGFETDLGGWAAVSGASFVRTTSRARTGTGCVNLYTGTAPEARRTITGLTVGRSYTVQAYAAPYAHAVENVALGVVGIGVGATTATGATGGVYTLVTYTFTATSTSHVVRMMNVSGASRDTLWDDVTLTRDAYTEGTGTPNDGLDGWTGGTNVASPRRSGARAFQGSTPSRTFTGLEVGRTYTLEGWRYNGTAWAAFSTQFTATSASMTRSITASGATHWDDLTLTRDAYTTVTNDGRDGWSGVNVQSVRKRSGTYAAYGTNPARAFTGLVIGHQYTLRGWYWAGTTWTQFGGTYTAAATAQSFSLPAGTNVYWDDVELIHHVPAETTPYAPLAISEGRVTLDENYAPYGISTVEVPLSDLGTLERIDPRDGQRVMIAAKDGPISPDMEPPRVFDLGLRGRTVNHKAGTVSLELATDEALLMDKRRLAATVDSTPRTFETSLRGVCNWALGKVGANLLAGTADADVTAAWDATNLQTNPTAGTDLSGWTGAGGTLSRQTTGPFPTPTIASFARVTMNAGEARGPYFEGGDTAAILSGTMNVSIREKQLYRVSAWVRTSVSKSIRLSVQQRNSAGALAGTNLNAQAFTTTANTWHRLTFVFQAYPGAVRVGVYAYLASGTYAAGQTVDITGVTITEGTLEVPHFDGGTAGGSDARYVYSWNGTPQLSTSERRALVPRPPELFDWKPGQSLWEFLKPLTESAGLRLFCDELRVWRLIDPAEYEVPGYVVVQSGHNATEGTDTISRNTEDWATGVLVTYRWVDAEGTQREAFDFAGTDDLVKRIERDAEYPGPGAAAYILNSLTGRGRVQDVTALVDFRATPTNDVSIDLPGTVKQTGKVRRVTFGLKTGLMEVGTRGLIDTLPGSWAAWNPTQTWSAVNPTLKWKDA